MIFQLILSLSAILGLWFMGNKSLLGPIIVLVSQALWIGYIIVTDQLGLAPGVAAYTIVSVRNLILWMKQE